MAKIMYGSWVTTADPVTGALTWTSVDGKVKLTIDMPTALGVTQPEWQAMTGATQWVASYGAKQKVDDGLAGKADNLTDYIELKRSRIDAFTNQEHVTGAMPFACEAIARIRKLPLDEVRAEWAKLAPERRATTYALPAVKAMVGVIESERNTARANAKLAEAGATGLEDFGKKE